MTHPFVRFSILLLSNIMLIVLARMVNDTLAAYSINLVIIGLLAIFPAFYLPFGQGFVCMTITSLLIDSQTPFLTWTLPPLLIEYCTLSFLKHRFQRQNDLHCGAIALISNFFIFLSYLFFCEKSSLANIDYWIRFFSDLFFSEMSVILIFYWFFEFQKSLLDSFVQNWENEKDEIS